MAGRPLCFVLMPFGKKLDPAGGGEINFDFIYSEAIQPGLEDAGLDVVRADAEIQGGIIHKAMFERLLLSEFAVADLSTANPNVFYELGVRHASRPHTTVTLIASHQLVPFDLASVRALPYRFGPGNAFGDAQARELRTSLGDTMKRLIAAGRESPLTDSPLFHLLEG